MATETVPYTHGGWKAEMGAMQKVYGAQIAPAAEHMLAGLRRLDAGDTQIAEFEKALGMIGDLVTEAARILAGHGADGDEVAEAIARAGGTGEVYGEKHAHQAG
jgi:hypothetical protein